MKMIKLTNKRINRMLNYLKLVKIIFNNEKFKMFFFSYRNSFKCYK